VERNSNPLWDENLIQFRPIKHDTAYVERCLKTNTYADHNLLKSQSIQVFNR